MARIDADGDIANDPAAGYDSPDGDDDSESTSSDDSTDSVTSTTPEDRPNEDPQDDPPSTGGGSNNTSTDSDTSSSGGNQPVVGRGEKDLDSGSAGGNSSGASSDDSTDSVTSTTPEDRPNEDPQDDPPGTGGQDADDPSDAPSATGGSGNKSDGDGIEEGDNPAGPGGPAPGSGTGSTPEPSTPQGPTGTQPTPDSVDLSNQEYEENYIPNENGVGTGLESIGQANRLDDVLAERGIEDAEYTMVEGDVVARYEGDGGTTQYVPIDIDGGGLTQSVEQSAAKQSAVNKVQSKSPDLKSGEDFTVSVDNGQPDVSLTESGKEQLAQQEQDLRAAAAAATEGSGEMARRTDATDFAAFSEEIAQIEQSVEEANPGMEAGEDFTVGINEQGEFTVNSTAQFQQQQREQSTEGIAAQARSEGLDAEKVEVQTGRDVDDDGSVTSQQEYLTEQLKQQLDAKTDANLTSGDVKAVRTQENGETVYKGVLTDSGEQKLENQAETSSFTAKIPEGVPVAGGASVTLKGESGGADVESTASGTTTETSERSVFGEFGGWYAAAEDTATDLPTEFMAASQDAAESVEGKVSLNPMAELLLRSQGRTESAEAIRESSTAATTGVVTAPAALSQGATTAAFEGPELAYALATSEEARRRAPGAAAGMAAQSASYAADNPYEVGAQAAVTTLASGGAVTALQGTRFAGAARFAASPVGTTARQFSDVDVSSVRGAAGSARERLSNIPTPDDERGMAQLPKFGSDSDGSSGSSDSGGVAGSLSEEIGEYLGRFERGERLRNAKQRAEERFLRDQQEAAERQERGSEPTTVDTRPGGGYVADSGPGGGYTASRTPDTSRSGPTEAQRRAYRSTITSDSSDSSTEAEQLLEQDDAAAELSSRETTVASLVGASGAGGLQALSDAQASQVSSEDSVTAEASQSQFLVTGDSAESAVTPQILAGIQNAQQPAVGSVGATVSGTQGSFQTTESGAGSSQPTGVGTATGTATRTDDAADTRADTRSDSQTGNAAAPDSTPPNTPQSGRGFGFPNQFGGAGVGVQSGLESEFSLRTEASAWGTETSIRADRPDDQAQARSQEPSLPASGDSTPRERGAGWLNKFAVALAGGGVQARSTPQDVEQYDSQTAALPLPTEGQVDPSESLQAGLEDVDNLFFGFGGVASSESSASSTSETSDGEDEEGWWSGGGWL